MGEHGGVPASLSLAGSGPPTLSCGPEATKCTPPPGPPGHGRPGSESGRKGSGRGSKVTWGTWPVGTLAGAGTAGTTPQSPGHLGRSCGGRSAQRGDPLLREPAGRGVGAAEAKAMRGAGGTGAAGLSAEPHTPPPSVSGALVLLTPNRDQPPGAWRRQGTRDRSRRGRNTDLRLGRVHRLLLEGRAPGQHGAVVLVADVLVRVVQPPGARPGRGPGAGGRE